VRVVEGQQNPAAFDRVPELFSVGFSQYSFASGGVNALPTTTEIIGDGDLDALVTVQRPRHAEAGSEDEVRKSSMWSQ